MKRSTHTKRFAAVLVAGFVSLIIGQTQAQTVSQEGEWVNTSFGSSGPLFIDFTLTPTTYSFTVDPDGFVFNAPDPDAVNTSGLREPDGSVILNIANDPTFGNITGTILADGTLQNVLFSDIPNPNIFNMTVEGDIGVAESSGTYLVNFNDPATRGGPGVEQTDFAQGTWTTTQIPEPASLALLGIGGLLCVHRRRA